MGGKENAVRDSQCVGERALIAFIYSCYERGRRGEGGREEEGIVYENRNGWERERYRVKRKKSTYKNNNGWQRTLYEWKRQHYRSEKERVNIAVVNSSPYESAPGNVAEPPLFVDPSSNGLFPPLPASSFPHGSHTYQA